MPASTMYSGKTTGSGTSIPLNPNGSVNINALINGMVSRDIWAYYYTLKLAAGTTFAAQYNLFNAASGSPDPYPLTGSPVLTHVETNMPSTCNNGFSAPRDLIMDQIGFYFLSAGSGLTPTGLGAQSGFANVLDMLAFCQYSYFEFKIIDKIFSEGFLELQPPGVGFTGMSTQQSVGVWTLGLVSPHSVNRLNNFAKYLAPLMPWSLNIFFPSGSGPVTVGSQPVSASLIAQGSGGNGLWLKSMLKGLTDRAVQ
jgi:hypothetical protein